MRKRSFPCSCPTDKNGTLRAATFRNRLKKYGKTACLILTSLHARKPQYCCWCRPHLGPHLGGKGSLGSEALEWLEQSWYCYWGLVCSSCGFRLSGHCPRVCWIPVLLAAAGVFSSILPFAISSTAAVAMNGTILILFVVSLEVLQRRRLPV